ncbi:hypothetical protein KM1_272610 [Entamoeba histolytica HM-3:IMSS]|uniref:Uncharacterized protein n=1 Tax=Entamoeba histolytica HM-3:IMSS TaxID=885315 RepID=M7W5A4_ENTHI|nr:hypothetical protein KM1_272610 [Entamoeba histolytica HM-3:IMSS]
MYMKLQEYIRKIERLIRLIIVPFVITVEIMINEVIKIPFEIMVKDIVISNMKDIIKYCGEHYQEYRDEEE